MSGQPPNIILVLSQQRFIPSLWFSEGFISSSNPKSVAGIGTIIANRILSAPLPNRSQATDWSSCQSPVFQFPGESIVLISNKMRTRELQIILYPSLGPRLSAIIYYQSDCHYPLSPVDRCISRLWYVSDKSPQLTETLPAFTKDDAVADRRGVCPGTSHWGKSVWLVVIFPWKSGWLLVNFLWNFTLLSPSVDSSWDEFQDS